MKPQIQEQEHEIAQIEKMAYKLESKLRLITKDQDQSYSLPLSTNTHINPGFTNLQLESSCSIEL